MAAITFTASEVLPGGTTSPEAGTAGETIGAGQAVYIDNTDGNRWKLAQNDDAERSGINGIGIAANGASAGQPIRVIRTGSIDFGASQVGVTSGVTLCVGAVAGQIVPDADVATTQFKTILCVGQSGGQTATMHSLATNAQIP